MDQGEQSTHLIHFYFSRRFVTIFVVFGTLFILAAVLLPLVQQAREAARRTQSRNNLKQLGIAIHNYHDVHSVFPSGGTIRDDGTPHHGWLTSLIPFLEATPIYSMIDFEYAWDHPFNIDLSANSSPTLLNPSVPASSEENVYRQTHYMANPSFLFQNSSVAISDFKGKSSSNWLAGEIGGGFQPAAYPFNWREWDGTLNRTATGYGLLNNPGANMLLTDGSVRYISKKQSIEVWKNFAKPNVKPSPQQIAVPPRTFPEHSKLLEREFFNKTEDGYATLLATSSSDGIAVMLRIFPAEKGRPSRGLTPADLATVLEKYPRTRQLTYHGGLTAKYANFF